MVKVLFVEGNKIFH